METISKSVKKTRKALIVEECMKTGGIGASLSAVIGESLFDDLDHQVSLCDDLDHQVRPCDDLDHQVSPCDDLDHQVSACAA